MRLGDLDELKKNGTVIAIVNGEKMKVVPVKCIDNAPTVEPNKELIIKFEKEIEYLQEAQYDLDDEGGAVYSSLQREIEMYESIIKTLRGEKK